MTEQQRTLDDIRRRAAGSVGQYGGDVAFLLDALEAALASIRWRDTLAEEWSSHMRVLTEENRRLRALLRDGMPRLSWTAAVDRVLAATTPAYHIYSREQPAAPELAGDTTP